MEIPDFSSAPPPAWELAGDSQLQRPAHGQTHRLRWCRPAEQCPLYPPPAGQSWVCLPRVGPCRASVADLWPVEPGRGDLRAAERCLPFPRWERRGDLPEHLPAGLQLPQGLLPGRQPGGPGLCVPASEDRPQQEVSGRALPTGAMAAGWSGGRPSSSRELPGHLPPHLLHRPEEASDWRPAHRRRQELHPESPSAPSVRPENRIPKCQPTPSQRLTSLTRPQQEKPVTPAFVVQRWDHRGRRFLWDWASRLSRCKRRRNHECWSYPVSQNVDLLKSCCPLLN